MKGNKNKKVKKKDSKQKPSEESQFGGMTFAMGEMDLIFEIFFDDKDLENPNSQSEDDKYYKIEDMKEIKDLSVIKDKLENEEFLNYIKLKPNNELTKQLILGNKISKKKSFIDLVCYGRPKFEGDSEFFDKVFDYVTVKNNLQINKTPLDENSRYSLLIHLRHKKKPEQFSEIKIGKTPAEEKEEKEKEEEEKKKEEEKDQTQKEEDEKNQMEERKKQKIKQYQERREKEKKKKEKGGEKNKEEEGEKKEEENNENQNDENNQQNEEQNNNNNNEQNNEEKKEEENEEEKEEEPEDYEETEAMKEKKIPKFKRQNVLCNLNPSCTKYDLIYINNEEISKIPGDFKLSYLTELLEHFKKKKSNIFINFYKNEPSKEEKEKEEAKKKEENKKVEAKKKEEQKKEEEISKNREKQMKDINDKRQIKLNRQKELKENKKKEIKEMEKKAKEDEINTIKTELEQLDEEEQNIKDEIRAEEEVKKEYKRKKEQEQEKEQEEQMKKDTKEMRQLNEIFFFTDGYFFDTKQACELFNKHYLCHTTDNKKNKKVLNKQKVFDYFITAIARGATDEVQGNKVGLFMEDCSKYTIIYCSKKTASKKELNAQPHPKINPHNINLVQQYQEIIKENKNDYYSIFACLAAHEISAAHNISTEVIYPSFLTSLEIIKRKVECQKNQITTINDDQIYKVKINEKALQQELEKLASDSKEGGFILDCTNKSKSTLKDYVALYDYHLRGFFSSQLIRKYLKNKGFIDSKGFIMYDPVYRNVMGAQCKNKKKYEGDELKEKIISSIKGIDVPTRIKDKELDAKKAIERQNVPIDKKIPYVKDSNQYKQSRKKKKKKKNGEGSSSSGASSEDENKSGDDSGAMSNEES